MSLRLFVTFNTQSIIINIIHIPVMHNLRMLAGRCTGNFFQDNYTRFFFGKCIARSFQLVWNYPVAGT